MDTIQLNISPKLNISQKYYSMTVKEYTEELKKLSDQNIKIFEGKFQRGVSGPYKRGESGPYNLTMAYLLFDPLFFIVYYEGNEKNVNRLTTKTHTILENTIGIQVKDLSSSTMLGSTVANYTPGQVREAADKEGITGDSCVAVALNWALNNYVGPDKQEDYKTAVEQIFGEEMRKKWNRQSIIPPWTY